MTKHLLKIWPEHFQRVKAGTKTFEIRENDRGFQRGDRVVLQEWDPTIVSHTNLGVGPPVGAAGFTGASLTFEVGDVYPIDERRVVFALINPGEQKL